MKRQATGQSTPDVPPSVGTRWSMVLAVGLAIDRQGRIGKEGDRVKM